jgi:hypothetical protein
VPATSHQNIVRLVSFTLVKNPCEIDAHVKSGITLYILLVDLPSLSVRDGLLCGRITLGRTVSHLQPNLATHVSHLIIDV